MQYPIVPQPATRAPKSQGETRGKVITERKIMYNSVFSLG